MSPVRQLLKGLIIAVAGLAVVLALSAAALIAWLTVTDPFVGPPHPTDGRCWRSLRAYACRWRALSA